MLVLLPSQFSGRDTTFWGNKVTAQGSTFGNDRTRFYPVLLLLPAAVLPDLWVHTSRIRSFTLGNRNWDAYYLKRNRQRERWFNSSFLTLLAQPTCGLCSDQEVQGPEHMTSGWSHGSSFPRILGELAELPEVRAGQPMRLSGPFLPQKAQASTVPSMLPRMAGGRRAGAYATKAGRAGQWMRARSTNLEVSGVGNSPQ